MNKMPFWGKWGPLLCMGIVHCGEQESKSLPGSLHPTLAQMVSLDVLPCGQEGGPRG